MAIQIPERLVRDVDETEETPGILHGISILIKVIEPAKNRPAVGVKELKFAEGHLLAGFGVQQRMAIQIYNRHLCIVLRRRHLVDRAVPGHLIIAVLVGRV